MIIAGPCQIESEEQGIRIANYCKKVCDSLGFEYYFKASFDKANRSHMSGKRGLGFKKGLIAISNVCRSTNVKSCIDFHDVSQIDKAEERGWLPDIIQIPAFLCRQTDLIRRAVLTGKIVNIKKGQFLAPWDMIHVVKKVASTGNNRIIITERGTMFGYNNLVVDFRSIQLMQDIGYAVVFDATHSVQLPGSGGDRSGGQKEFVGCLTKAAVAVGINALFLEVHDRPDKAKCDGPNMITPDEAAELLPLLLRIDSIVKEDIKNGKIL